MDELLALPSAFAAGTTVAYRRSFGDFPASAWDLALLLGGPGTPRSFAAAPDGDEFVVTIAAVDSAKVDQGWHAWTERATHKTDGRVKDVVTGRVLVRVDLGAAGADATLSFYERLLPVVENYILTGVKRGFEAFSVGGVSLSTIDMDRAQRLRATAISAINAARAGGPVVGEVLARFSRVGFDE